MCFSDTSCNVESRNYNPPKAHRLLWELVMLARFLPACSDARLAGTLCLLTCLPTASVDAAAPRDATGNPSPTLVGTLSVGRSAQRAAPNSDSPAGRMECLRALVLGASPTCSTPSVKLGLTTLGLGAPLPQRAGSSKTAWLDYVATPWTPAWTLMRKSKPTLGLEGASWRTPPTGTVGSDVSPGGRGLLTGVDDANRSSRAMPARVASSTNWTSLADPAAASPDPMADSAIMQVAPSAESPLLPAPASNSHPIVGAILPTQGL